MTKAHSNTEKEKIRSHLQNPRNQGKGKAGQLVADFDATETLTAP